MNQQPAIAFWLQKVKVQKMFGYIPSDPEELAFLYEYGKGLLERAKNEAKDK